MSVPSKSSVGSGNGKSGKMKSDHKVVIYGDSHSRGLSARLKDKLPDSFEVIGYTKPNCDIQSLLSIRNQDIRKLSNKDVLIFIGGTNDLTSDNPSRGLWHISQFVKQNTQDKYYSVNNTSSL
jgi:hypothetical protein